MKDIDNFIKDNAPLFNDDEPDDEHFNKFRNKIKKESGGIKNWSFNYVYKIASIAAILVLCVLVSIKYYKTQNKQETADIENMHLADVSEEYKEVENYLISNVDSKIKEFQDLNCENSDLTINMVMEELKELDDTYIELQEELKENKNDQRIIDAMIDCYQNKIELLNTILTQVNKNC